MKTIETDILELVAVYGLIHTSLKYDGYDEHLSEFNKKLEKLIESNLDFNFIITSTPFSD